MPLRALLLLASLPLLDAAFRRVPVIDVAPLVTPGSSAEERQRVVDEIGAAAMDVGFFQCTGHGVSEELMARLDAAAAGFFAQPRAVKRQVEMAVAGRRWRGYFEVGEELTSGRVDQKEGLYFAQELPASDDRPLHGPNLFPAESVAPGLRAAVLEYMSALGHLSDVLLRAVSAALGLGESHFAEAFREPTTLFRIFHYPPHDAAWGDGSMAVGEHTDYGYLTVLRQDDAGGLQAKCETTGEWVDVPPVAGAFVVNLGDALEHNTGGLLRATPHRVLPRVGAPAGRFSFPFFFDPRFDARMGAGSC